ncbi:transferase hexapeptide (six repeat-containing protein) [Alistipes timonensis JC136]|uniref:Transferase hexapeptide (Six repeat-containing protein) n=1 Tax=Alistipes timonensis JC136 TaxID=1033731 RepID=A0A1H4AWR1_9BACT|nr:acyltransferase [Alistipes timonensis]SEA40321.1 transferase hexapeptide (six repeat-containing protein) [Alistipes timonensis JC136]
MIEKIKQNPRLRRLTLWLLTPSKRPRPRWWLRLLRPLLHPAGKGSKICSHARADIFPWHRFVLERDAQIEDFAVVNNGAGDVRIGEGSRVGVGSVVVGPVDIGRYVFLGQHVSVQGLIHGYEDVTQDPNLQPLMLRPVKVGDYTHLGTNSTIMAGVTIGERCQIGAGSVVTKDIPPYTVAVGNPARAVKRYDFEKKEWVRV